MSETHGAGEESPICPPAHDEVVLLPPEERKGGWRDIKTASIERIVEMITTLDYHGIFIKFTYFHIFFPPLKLFFFLSSSTSHMARHYSSLHIPFIITFYTYKVCVLSPTLPFAFAFLLYYSTSSPLVPHVCSYRLAPLFLHVPSPPSIIDIKCRFRLHTRFIAYTQRFCESHEFF
jgi:hypothetical protein